MARSKSPSDPGTRTPRAGGERRTLLFLVAVPLLTVSLVVGAVIVVALAQGEEAARTAVNEDLGATQAVQTAFQQQRYQRLSLISRLFATDQLLNTYLAEAAEDRDPTAIEASIGQYQDLLTFDLGVVLDRSGMVLARTDGDDGVGESLAATPLVSAAALEEKKSSGVWRESGALYHAVAVPLVREFDRVGYTVVAYAVNNALASQVKRSGGADVVYFAVGPTGPEVVASTLPGDRSGGLVTALRRDGGDAFDRVLNRGETVSEVSVGLGEEEWVVSLSPLRDAAGDPVGAVAALTETGSARLGYRLVILVAAGAGVAAVLLAVVLLIAWHRRSGGPVAELADAAEAAEGGRLDVEIPPAGGELGRLSEALRGILGRMREKRALEAAYAGAAFDAEAGRDASRAGDEARTVEAAVVAVELRRYAHPKLGYDPSANAERFAADVERIERCARAAGGRVAAVAGHRVLALFEGESHALRGLEAAAAVALSLGPRDADGGDLAEASPVAVAFEVGTLVVGSLRFGGLGAGGDDPGAEGRSASVAGLPVQLLDALLREAEPGAIYFSKPAWNVLGRTFHEAGVEVKAQRAVLSTQPLYFVAPEPAAELTGARPVAAAAERPAAAEELAPGRTLGSRFRLLEDLGGGPLGPVFRADDGQMGELVRLRLLRAEALRDSTRFERLKQVVSRCRVLRHGNALGVYDFGEVGRRPFVSMEWAPGLTLAQILERTDDGRLSPPAVLRLLRHVAWGVAAAHGHQVMHGALEPGNLLVQADGKARVMDFGLARVTGLLLDPAAEKAFLAPEQLLGGEDDSRVDFWSLGAMAYRLLAGRPPLGGDDLESLRAAAERARSTGGPPDLAEVAPQVASGLPAELLEILRRCLEPEADDRYPTVEQLLRDLESVRL